jgi:predicted transcriptional regulator
LEAFMPNRQRKREHRPLADGYAERLTALRELLHDDAAAAGDQALKLLEEYLESLSHMQGYHGDASLGRSVSFLRGRDVLDPARLDRADGYTQVRNCIAHNYGLQTSPALAEEVLEFIELLLKQGAPTAAHLMTRSVRTVATTDRLLRARDLMLREGYGRLPVLREGAGVVGLLTERDVVAAQAQVEQAGGSLAQLSVADALPADAAERCVFVSPEATRAEIVDVLRAPGAVACLVTAHGSPMERPLGIITHADLLYQM